MFNYCWTASMGPPLSMTQGPHNRRIAATLAAARATYQEDMDHKLGLVAKAFEELLNAVAGTKDQQQRRGFHSSFA